MATAKSGVRNFGVRVWWGELAIAGEVISDVLRQNDLKAHLGGDEFAFLLASVALHRATYICEQILLAFKAQTGSSISIRATFSTAPSPDLHVLSGVADEKIANGESNPEGPV